ncbi:Glu-tRNA(Gln) amidotransferase subunit GatE [Candidatus Woesearchaeota archaeon]|nr:Glu-tRNA(Gln) amidotransferase subunit GatE [Candidatus Woesearchaeota archaeon]
MELDYIKLGLKIGLEIHQQLDTHKLFCNCPSDLRDDKPDIIFKRKIRASAGETGSVDIAAVMEKEKGLSFIYEGYSDTNCLVELDEEPPGALNLEALEIVLQVAKMLNAKVSDRIEFMRKTIANGSVTAGFQRTGLVAVEGKLHFDFGDVGVPTILLEEEAAKEVESTPDIVTWRLDRLGIPLIELSTAPEIYTPEQCREVAAYIGMILRSTGKAKRGLGTIRQDININIAGADRVEIKGVQDLRMIPKIVEYEVIRQKSLIDISKKVPQKIRVSEIYDLSKLFIGSDSKVIKNALEKVGVVLGIKLEGLHGFLGQEIQPGRRLGTEVSDWAKARGGVGGIFHSDELPKYGITDTDVENIKNMLEYKDGDAFVIVADLPDKSNRALYGVIDRVKLLPKGVIKQVRKVNTDATTSFMRLMPGAARMYPETDILPVVPDLLGIKLPELISEKSLRYEKEFGLSKDLAQLVAKSEQFLPFEKFCGEFKNIKPAFIAETYLKSEKAVKHVYAVDIGPSDEDFNILFSALDSGKIAKDSILEILSKNKPVNQVIDNFKLMDDNMLEDCIKQIVSKNKGLPFNALIGKVMAKLKGKADGKKAVELLNKIFNLDQNYSKSH